MKRKRDDYNLANNVPADDSDHDGSTENDAESSNNSLSSSSSSLNTSNHSVYSFAYPVGEESTVLGRDELIALEFLCCNKKDNYCPLETKSDGYSASFSELMYTPASPTKTQADERKKQEYKSPISPMLQNFQLKESFSSCGKYTEQNKNKEDLDTTRRNSDHP